MIAAKTQTLRRNSAHSAYRRKWLAEKPRAFEPVTPGPVDGLGNTDARPGDDLHRTLARK